MFRAIAFAIGLIVIIGCSQQANDVPSAAADAATAAVFNAAGAPTIEFSVPDMMCADGCAVAVKEILAKQPGAKDVIVDFDAKTATVAIEDGKFDAGQALAALVDKRFDHSTLKADAASDVIAKPQAAAESAVQ